MAAGRLAGHDLMNAPSARRRVLFVGEAVTLAHVVRPVVLARALDPAQYEITLACDDRYLRLFGELPFAWRPLATLPTATFLDRLAKGRPVYDFATLRAYARDDLALLEAVRPDLVVGDFRISLGVSARVAGIPYWTVTNAYWGPYSQLPFPLPEHPLANVLGVGLAQALFGLARPLAFALHARPLERLRREYGLPGLGYDLRAVYTDADRTLYADLPDFVPTQSLPPHHQWLGPVLWSPAGTPPDWWAAVPEDRPIVYVALGSSGEIARALPVILQGLADLPVTVIAATAGQPLASAPPKNAWVAEFLPGVAAAARSQLVICNGGSLATQQALAAGVPVLGVVSNLDQHLNMLCLERAGVGLRLRVGRLTAAQVQTATQHWLDDAEGQRAAGRWRSVIAQWDTGRTFREGLAKSFNLTS